MKKFGVLLEGTLKAGRLLNKYYIDFDGANIIFAGNPRSFYVSKPFENSGFEYFDRTLIRLPYVARFFSEKEDVRKKTFNLFINSIKMVHDFKLKGLILNFGIIDSNYMLIDLWENLKKYDKKDKIYVMNEVEGVLGNVDYIRDMTNGKVVVDLAKMWGFGADITDGRQLDKIEKDDIVIVNGNKYNRGLHKIKTVEIDSKDNVYKDYKSFIIENLKGDLIFNKRLEELYAISK